ncbi:hypothetical protein PII47_23530 [Pseudomonas sp. 21TX0197]|uniref:hypothetical protein n=1 Tax=unclassified Pseudomonas TaxID=196821 RepID=UPI001C43915E|nr:MULTISPECIES: hypothetical protein [unclassified Pseudomonas]MDB6446370.1 hypothetical protein [Pseudomonas sp. 21TX0197]
MQKNQGITMCGGVEAADKNRAYERVKVYFPNPKAALPVVLEDGTDLGWVRWGRRREEKGTGPSGGWAKLETVERGGWEKYHPQRALGLVQRYMEKDGERVSHWFDMNEGFGLECLVLGEDENRRVYVVTTSPPADYAWIHDRWPMIGRLPREVD